MRETVKRFNLPSIVSNLFATRWRGFTTIQSDQRRRDVESARSFCKRGRQSGFDFGGRGGPYATAGGESEGQEVGLDRRRPRNDRKRAGQYANVERANDMRDAVNRSFAAAAVVT